MDPWLKELGISVLYLLALINPISKVSILSGLYSDHPRDEMQSVTVKASMVAAGILLGAMIFGDFLLRSVFRVELYSLRFAGGSVLFWVGFNALRKGVFFEQDSQMRFMDMALVPLACPMIAGPATIAASIALRARGGILIPTIAVILALSVNHLIMRFARPIANLLTHFNILGAIIRITGLIVMTIGTQMALEGIAVWRSL